MLRVPARFAAILVAFAPVFVQARTWQHARMLVLGALLVPGQRTVCSILRIIGLRQERHFVTWHRVLSRAVWDSRLAARVLLKLRWYREFGQWLKLGSRLRRTDLDDEQTEAVFGGFQGEGGA